MADIAGDGLGLHLLEMEIGRHPLRQLAHPGMLDHGAQLRLADQDQLHQHVLVGIDVGQHPQLLEPLHRQVLRLVEDQDDAPPGGIFGKQEVLQLLEHLHVARRRIDRNLQRVQDPLDQLAPVALGVGDQPDGDILVDLRQQLLQQRGLARADLAGHQGDRRLRQDPVFEHREGLLVLAGPVEKPRIRDQREGPLGQAEEGRIEHV